MRLIYKFFIPIFFYFPLMVKSQVTFEIIYPAVVHESGKDVLQTSDGGYIISASTETSIIDDLDMMVMRTDVSGNFLWKKSYGGNMPEVPNGILKANDGNYFIIGYTQSFGSGDFDHYLLKVDPAGDSIFSKVYGGYGNEEGKEIISTSDGNYVIVGASNSISFSDNNVQLIKIDINGNVIWTKYYGGPGYESARSVKECADGGFIIAGKQLNTSGIASIFLIRTDSGGDTIWTKILSGPNSLEGKSVLVNSDGSYTLSVDDSSAIDDSDVRIMKIDPTGNIVLWDKLYSGTLKDITKMIKPTTDGGYIVTALSRSFGWIEPDYWVLRLNSVGDTLWTKHFGGADHEHCYAVRQTSDSGYIVVGHTRSNNASRIEEILLVKLNSNGEFGPVGMDEVASNEKVVTVFPNPSNGLVTLNFSHFREHEAVFRITNALGQMIYSGKVDSVSLESVVDLKDNGPGVYYITLQTTSGSVTKKLILN